MKEMFNNSISIAKILCSTKLKTGDVVVDCTMGKGNDTLFLSNIVGESGTVYAFDIQKEAIQKTNQKLDENNIKNVDLICDGHENMDKYIKEKVNLFMFNLGYLPSFDHTIKTQKNTTIIAIKKALNLLEKKGVVIIVVYPGHKEGMEEKIAIEDYVKNLNQKEFNVFEGQFLNQINNPPCVITVEKR